MLVAAVHVSHTLAETAAPVVQASASSSSSIALTWSDSSWQTVSIQTRYGGGDWLTVGILPASAREFTVGGLLDSSNYTLRLCDGAAAPPSPSAAANYTGNCSAAFLLHGVQLSGCAKILEHEHHFTGTALDCCTRCTNYTQEWGGAVSCAAWSWDSSVQHGDCELYGSAECQQVPKHSSTAGLLRKIPGPSPPSPTSQCSQAVNKLTSAVNTTPRGVPVATGNKTYPRNGEGTVVRDGKTLFYFYGRWLGNGGDLGESEIVYQSASRPYSISMPTAHPYPISQLITNRQQ